VADAEIEVVNNRADSRFEIHKDGHTAFAEYRLKPDVIIFPHTVTPKELEGQGLGGRLVKAGMAFAKAEGLMVVPTCTFFAGYIQRHPEYWEQVVPKYREELGLNA
jgi:predicted GNAT family acetyltransferase